MFYIKNGKENRKIMNVELIGTTKSSYVLGDSCSIIVAKPEVIKENSNIYYDHTNGYDTYSIIKNADVCVTINSQAGLESLLLGKIVITCGNAFYNCLNSVYQALNKHHLGFLLSQILKETDSGVDMDQVYKFFYIFCEKYCLPKNESSYLRLAEKSIIHRGRW